LIGLRTISLSTRSCQTSARKQLHRSSKLEQIIFLIVSDFSKLHITKDHEQTPATPHKAKKHEQLCAETMGQLFKNAYRVKANTPQGAFCGQIKTRAWHISCRTLL